MNLADAKYREFGLVQDMLATPRVVASFDVEQTRDVAAHVAQVGRLFMTGEGSSRIFPAKHAIWNARRQGLNLALHTEGGRQAQAYDLSDWAVFGLSNSGRTAEVIQLFRRLAEANHPHRYSLTAFEETTLESLATKGFVLSCGKEGAVAATKSVIEQALFYDSMFAHIAGTSPVGTQLPTLARKMEEALTMPIDPEITGRIAAAPMIYWAGRNTGVAEELTLKTNEITRKSSDFLEGTYAVHGVEEVMSADDVVIWIDPFEDQESKFQEVLVDGVGLTVIALASHPTRFPTIQLPGSDDGAGYIRMAGGWNLLVETGIRLGIDLDKPERARKVGNEFSGP